MCQRDFKMLYDANHDFDKISTKVTAVLIFIFFSLILYDHTLECFCCCSSLFM